MAGNFNMDEDDGITGINVTPLVDVMLVLLIIFMVTANYIQNDSIGLSLPKSETAKGNSEPTDLEFTIKSDGKYFYKGKSIELASVQNIIEEEKKANPKLEVTVSADQEVSHGKVMKLIDTVRKNGVTDFAISVEGS